MRTIALFLVWACVLPLSAQSVTDTINQQVWSVFSEAYSNHDPQLFQSIHSQDLVRVSGNGKKIYNAEEYFNRNIPSFERRKSEGEKVDISFRFLDRFSDRNMASEQGIYQLVIEKPDGQVNQYYGQFHVLLRRELGKWVIVMDYDANPDNTIGEAEYLMAKP